MAGVSRRRVIDIAVNLTDSMFFGVYHGKEYHAEDVAAVVRRCHDNNVTKCIITGTDLAESTKALELARTSEFLFSTCGVHPTRCNVFNDPSLAPSPEVYLQKLKQLIDSSRDKIVAVGEFGLDYDRLEFCDKETQNKYFDLQFELADHSKLPLFLHCRNSAADFADVIRRNRDRFKHGVAHSFDGSLDELKLLLDQNLYIGINGCSLKTAENLAVAAAIPSNRLMVETDSPYCDIRPTHASYSHVKTHFDTVKNSKYNATKLVKGRNEPCAVWQVLEVLASVRNTDVETLSEQVYTNTEQVFFSKTAE